MSISTTKCPRLSITIDEDPTPRQRSNSTILQSDFWECHAVPRMITTFAPSPLNNRCRYLGSDDHNLLNFYHNAIEKPTKNVTRGAYCVLNHNTPYALFKPSDEVRGGINSQDKKAVYAKDGIPHELEIPNEVIAAGLFPHWTPCVIEASLTGDFYWAYNTPASREKSGSLQPFIPDTITLRDVPRSELDPLIASLDVETVHQIAILDIALCNTDRHLGNLLYQKTSHRLYPIDHACILPQEFASSAELAWMSWPQADIPLSPELRDKVNSLNAATDIQMILQTYPTFPRESLETLELCYFLLQEGTQRGLTLHQIGSLLTKENRNSFGSFMTLAYQLYRELPTKERQAMLRSEIQQALDSMNPLALR